MTLVSWKAFEQVLESIPALAQTTLPLSGRPNRFYLHQKERAALLGGLLSLLPEFMHSIQLHHHHQTFIFVFLGIVTRRLNRDIIHRIASFGFVQTDPQTPQPSLSPSSAELLRAETLKAAIPFCHTARTTGDLLIICRELG